MYKLALALALALPAHSVAESLSLQEALSRAGADAPELTAAQSRGQAAGAELSARGRWPNPRLVFGVDNLPVSGPQSWRLSGDAMTMRRVGLMQDIPNGGSRAAEVVKAEAAVARARADRALARQRVLIDTTVAWIGVQSAQRRRALLDEYARESELLVTTATAQVEAARAASTKVLEARLKALELGDLRDAIETELEANRISLRRRVRYEEPLTATGELPEWDIEPSQLEAHVEAHPDLAVAEAGEQAARGELRSAEAAGRPDLAVELSYGRRAPEFGDMISMQLSVGLPVFRSTRNEPLLEAARSRLDQAHEDRRAMQLEHTRELGSLLVEHSMLDRQWRRSVESRVPMLQQKVQLQTSAFAAGTAELDDVIEAREALLEERMRGIELQARRSVLAAKLHFAYGPERAAEEGR